ncbi:MAG: restriction endonuclease [SAR324 cluster bacterium]|nr:restriction endonuclease [SAR324 cluster bacterium]
MGGNRTWTEAKLPFGDLSPIDFERLCCALLTAEGHSQVRHWGAAGAEQGCDLVSVDRDGRRVVTQCKRVKELGPTEAEVEVRKVLKDPPSPPPAERRTLTVIVAAIFFPQPPASCDVLGCRRNRGAPSQAISLAVAVQVRSIAEFHRRRKNAGLRLAPGGRWRPGGAGNSRSRAPGRSSSWSGPSSHTIRGASPPACAECVARRRR